MATLKHPQALYKQELLQRQLSDEDVTNLGLRLMPREEASKLVGYAVPRSCFIIPYAGDTGYFRLRLLGDIPDGWRKYLGPKKIYPPLYYPPLTSTSWDSVRADPTQPICITEGELKSFIGSKMMGLPVLAIGGVTLQAPLFEGNWLWKERPVAICFDHDEGMPAGEYKPEVANQLGQLCSKLSHAGANVVVWHIGKTGVDRSEKWGLDDYLIAGNSPKTLVETQSLPPEWSQDLAELLDNCVYVIGTDHTHVYTKSNGSRKAVKDFHEAHVEKRRTIMDGDKVKVEQVSKLWTTHAGRVTVEGYSMNPRLPFGVQDGSINLWRGYPEFEGADTAFREGVQVQWQRFMEGLFGEHWKWVGLWAGHLLNRPWESTNQAIMLLTMVQGIGKSLWGDIVKDLCGVHGLEESSSVIFAHFNAAEEGKTFIMVNELDVKFSSKEGQLNDLLSTETVAVTQKRRDTMVLPNLRRFFFTTNTSSPCRLSKNQRRVLVVTPPRIMGDTRGEWGTWVDKVIGGYRKDERALAAIRSWFDDLWYVAGEGEWNPKAPVPITEAGAEAAEASMTTNQILATHMYEMALETWEGVACAHPDFVREHNTAFAELARLVKGHGGQVGVKAVLIAGRTVSFKVYDTARYLGSKVRKDGMRTVDIEKEVVEGKALALAQEMVQQFDRYS